MLGLLRSDDAVAEGRPCGGSFSPPEGGGGIFFVSNNLTGTLTTDRTYIWNCPSGSFHTAPWVWLFYLGSGPPQILASTHEEPPSEDLFCDGFESGLVDAWAP